MQLHVSCCYYLLVTAISEALERRPAGIGLSRFLDTGAVVSGKVGEQIKARHLLDVVDAHCVVGITIADVCPVLKPESDGRRRCDGVPAPFNLQEGFPIVVRDRNLRRIRILSGGPGQV